MTLPLARTIFALSSGAGRAGLAVIRISGPEVASVLRAIGVHLPMPRVAKLVKLRAPDSMEVLDHAIVLWFPGPASFTGEDVAELHVHGGGAVVKAIVAALASLPGVYAAEPGEFSRRAFENNKLDLTQAEGISDLIAAETEAQRRQALRQTEGELGALYEKWRSVLVRALAYLEADIDFAEEEQLPEDLAKGVTGELGAVKEAITGHLADGKRGERLREGVSVAIVGLPNSGKSSLLNVFAGRDAAIVSEVAGTTRDIIEVHLNLGEVPVIFADTAGLREAADGVEQEGVRRAIERADNADFKLVLMDARLWPPKESQVIELIDEKSFVVVTKVDCEGPVFAEEFLGQAVFQISAKTGQGVPELIKAVETLVTDRFGVSVSPSITRSRHRSALEECVEALKRFLNSPSAHNPELAAEDIRLAARALGRITGRIDVEEILDAVFRDFCIGK